MGSAPDMPTPQAPPKLDTFGARLRALQYAESQRKLRETRGRAQAFMFQNLNQKASASSWPGKDVFTSTAARAGNIVTPPGRNPSFGY